LDRIATFINNTNWFRIRSFFLSYLSIDLRGKIVSAAPNAHDLAIPRHLKQNVGGVSAPHFCVGHDIPHRESLTGGLESGDNPSPFIRSKHVSSATSATLMAAGF
jgi:hypothetical protein